MQMGADESAVLHGAVEQNNRRRIAEHSTPAAITTQEGIDGYREKAVRNVSVEQVEFGQHHGVVDHGSCARMGKTIEPLWVTVAEKNRWMELEESLSLDSCQALS